MKRLVFSFVWLMLLSGCAKVNPYYNPVRPHHTPQGFQNNYFGAVDKTFSEFARWQVQRVRQDLPKPPERATLLQLPDLAALQRVSGSGSSGITWVGHASMLVQAGGLNVLTDPIFSERASPLMFLGPRRAQPPGVALRDLPPIDVVLISHNHYDHLDKASVLGIAERSQAAGRPTLFLVPLGLKSWFVDLGLSNTIELDWWDKHVVRGIEFNFTPVQHWSSRSFSDRNQSLWGGYAVFAPELHWYFTGDTGYSKDFADTQARFAGRHTASQGGGFDLALIPVGAYAPRWFLKDQHVNPDEAVQIHRDLRAKRSIGIHWGTFELSDESLDQPTRDLVQAVREHGLPSAEFTVMAIGETRPIPARKQP